LLQFITGKRTATIAIYFGMFQYASLWIFPSYQSQILLAGLFFYALRIPYFIRINEKAIVQQSAFFFSVELIAVFLRLDHVAGALRECYAIF